ncbi:hypothetical protein [Neoaquamicrobium microcysteis]|jgi:hypothetical protein|uniref:hypothetical protein n=1 Tax=Neoaquamicrobium microcysteis TaxID=2682781 RepID=UPI001F161B0C|nr:hypothetical protein [Mesorhizobium microcysteis]
MSQVGAAAFQSMIFQGKTLWTAPELRALVERKAANFRAYASERRRGIPLLGSDELKARLLYNGITRARRTCKVFVRGPDLLQQAPFDFNAA